MLGYDLAVRTHNFQLFKGVEYHLKGRV